MIFGHDLTAVVDLQRRPVDQRPADLPMVSEGVFYASQQPVMFLCHRDNSGGAIDTARSTVESGSCTINNSRTVAPPNDSGAEVPVRR